MTAPTMLPLAAEPVVDGRRLRSEASRLRIVEAMIALVSEGLTMPPAEAVASRAGVGLRTVFRLFEDMDGLYRGMQAVMTARLGGLLEAPVEASNWREAIEILIDRRSEAFEILLPLQIAADSPRTRSAALREGRGRLVQGQRDALLAILPAEVQADPELVQALYLALSFEAWRRLRTDQGADIATARAVMRRMASALTGDRA
ncbi:MAG: TetR/AcrR family transcriptional regulator [Phenylobacterium sp.]|uniref:TetR/AcrR family transcriptional regulator n=1 Tax=Phenylobacterium sp. TaxID=1871053 RepID=UPI00271CEE06|nr:TetR/AcrR family transcriptional regulator [Phenylobacterium sp.]MDO9430194.1 TetR/AcrR family transcriptional regulator [Phenylobacterium sp.]